MAIAGISTLGVTFGYGLETTAGTKPASFTTLTRVSSIGGISISPETIDASALEDLVEKSVAGRATTGGSFDVVINLTDETEAEWSDLIDAYNGKDNDKQMWFKTSSPYLTKSFYVIAQPPLQIPQPEIGQNGLMTVTFPLTIVDYKGLLA